IANPRNVAARLQETERITVRQADGNRGNPFLTFISEKAFYKVVLRSDKPAAEPFVDWVTGEVLPSIRRFGCYPAPERRTPDLLPCTQRVLQAAQLDLVIPEGYWCVFTESASVLIQAEHVFVPAGLSLDADDLLDGSVGRHWGGYRKGQYWAGVAVRYSY